MKKILIAIAGMALLWSCKHETPSDENSTTFTLSDTMLRTTTTAPVNIEPLKNSLKFYGKITADNNKLIEVYPLVGGNVVKVYAELGDYVQKGQLLATIRSTEVASIEKDLVDAKNDVLIARNDVKVAQELYEGKLNTERDVLEAKSKLDKAESNLNRIMETYRIYNLKQGAVYQVTAPISGFIIQKNINEDMQLRSDRTDNIFDIAQIENVWAIANINESDISEIKLGVDADVSTLSYADRIYHGKVDKIFNIIDPETKAMKVRIILDNKDYSLKPEMRASISINFTEDKKMPAIPSEAVIFDKSKYFVMIMHDRYNIETRPVEVFRQLGGTTYITSGLKEGEKVITHNQLLIYDALND